MNAFLRCYLWVFMVLAAVHVNGQQDTMPRKQEGGDTELVRPAAAIVRDTQAVMADTLQRDTLIVKSQTAVPPRIDTSTYRSIAWHPYVPLTTQPIWMLSELRQHADEDLTFYLLMGVLLVLGFIRTAFPRYFSNMFSLFFKTSLRQKQTMDQLLQDNLGSLFVNILFIITTSIYAALVIEAKEWLNIPFWHIVSFGASLLVAVYMGKFLFLQFAGWVFNAKEAAGQYTFTVFLVNKVLGVLLVPFLFLMAFSSPGVQNVAYTLSLGIIVILLAYRYLVSFSLLRKSLRVNALHFFLYLCAVEILPLALLYNLMADYIRGRF